MAAQYLSKLRLRPTSTNTRKTHADESESDRARVIFSAPFRRMHEKAQVFSLEDDDGVRTRLTHSLEVAHIGRSLTQSIIANGRKEIRKIGITSDDTRTAAITIVENACLLHDIGNPPFGHFGEKVIKHWFIKNEDFFKEAIGIETNSHDANRRREFEDCFKDFSCFDGNPQGFRIVSKLQWNYDENGLNLTATQLSSLLKYDSSPKFASPLNPLRKKAGYFLADSHVIDSVRRKLKMKDVRHPLSYLMEAADDIAYCLSDIEDGIEKGLISGYQIRNKITRSKIPLLRKIYGKSIGFKAQQKGQKLADLKIYLGIKTRITNELVKLLTNTYIKNIGSIKASTVISIVDQCPQAKAILKLFRDLAREFLYDSKVVRENEIIANKVLTGLLDTYRPLLVCNIDRFDSIRKLKSLDKNQRSISVEHALYLQFSEKFINVYEKDRGKTTIIVDEAIREWILRAHLVIDEISGMTDKYALSKFKMMCST